MERSRRRARRSVLLTGAGAKDRGWRATGGVSGALPGAARGTRLCQLGALQSELRSLPSSLWSDLIRDSCLLGCGKRRARTAAAAPGSEAIRRFVPVSSASYMRSGNSDSSLQCSLQDLQVALEKRRQARQIRVRWLDPLFCMKLLMFSRRIYACFWKSCNSSSMPAKTRHRSQSPGDARKPES